MCYVVRTASVLVYGGRPLADRRIIPTGRRKLGQMLATLGYVAVTSCHFGVTAGRFGVIWVFLGFAWGALGVTWIAK